MRGEEEREMDEEERIGSDGSTKSVGCVGLVEESQPESEKSKSNLRIRRWKSVTL